MSCHIGLKLAKTTCFKLLTTHNLLDSMASADTIFLRTLIACCKINDVSKTLSHLQKMCDILTTYPLKQEVRNKLLGPADKIFF